MSSPDEAIYRAYLRRQMEQSELGALYAATSRTTATQATLGRFLRLNKDYGELAKGLMRRRPVLFGVFGAVLAVATIAAFQVPRVYKSSAMILIQPGQTSQPGGAGLMNPDQRLRTLRPLITSRTELEAIINELGLYRDLGSRQPMESLAEHARARIEVEVRGRDLFRVSFVHPLPETAQIVTSRLSRKLPKAAESCRDLSDRGARRGCHQAGSGRGRLPAGRGDDLKGVQKTWDAKIQQFQTDNADTLSADQPHISTLATSREQLKLKESSLRAARAHRGTVGRARRWSPGVPILKPGLFAAAARFAAGKGGRDPASGSPRGLRSTGVEAPAGRRDPPGRH